MPSLPPEKHLFTNEERTQEITTNVSWSDGQSQKIHLRLQELVSRLGLVIPPNSRYQQYIKALEVRSLDLKLRVTSYIEIYQMLTALENIKATDPWKVTIENALHCGSVLPYKAARQTRDRDFQFELYIAGLFSKAGIPVHQKEPDIICDMDGFIFGVAAKRIKSKKKIYARIKEASSQIVKSRIPGIIALDFTPLQDSYFSEFPFQSIDEFQAHASGFMERVFEPLLSEISRRVSERSVFGIIAFAVVGAQEKSGHRVLVSPIHSGRRLCYPNSTKAPLMWEIVDRLSRTPAFDFSRMHAASC
jgi:hypothetical protein